MKAKRQPETKFPPFIPEQAQSLQDILDSGYSARCAKKDESPCSRCDLAEVRRKAYFTRDHIYKTKAKRICRLPEKFKECPLEDGKFFAWKYKQAIEE